MELIKLYHMGTMEASAELVSLVPICGVPRCLLVSVMSPQMVSRKGVSFRRKEKRKKK